MDFRSVGIIGRWVGLAAFTLLVRSGPFLSFFSRLGMGIKRFRPALSKRWGRGCFFFFRGVFPPGRTYKASCRLQAEVFVWMDG